MRTVQLELLRPGEILAERARCSIVYLPVGPLEWHGPAMPYGTDALLAQSLARRAAEKTGGVAMPTLFIGTERERPASILRDKGFENPEQMYVLGMDVPKNSMKSFYAREDMFAGRSGALSARQRTQAYRRMSRTITRQTATRSGPQACVPLSADAIVPQSQTACKMLKNEPRSL